MPAAVINFAIELTEGEKNLLSRIDFDPSTRSRKRDSWPTVADAMEKLTHLLLKRNAIPEARLQYIADPDCNVGGGGSSRQQIIERNGYPTPMVRKPAFVKHLHYLIYGPDLPKAVMDAFQQKASECGEPFTGSDALTVAAYTRQLTRSHGLDPQKAHEEFYKLALECGLDAGDARSVRDSVMKVRR